MVNINKSDVKGFLEQEIVRIYNSKGFSGLECWARDYEGKFDVYLPKVMGYLSKKNSEAGTRLFSLTSFDVEDILKKTISQEAL